MRFRIGILKNESDNDHIPWVRACEEHSGVVEYMVLDLTCASWLEQIEDYPADMYVTRSPGQDAIFKTLYDERLFILSEVMRKPIFPNLLSNLLYENKRMMAYWLRSNGFSHPDTLVSYYMEEAVAEAHRMGYPIVAKTYFGAGGAGVRFLRNETELISYCRSAFQGTGLKRAWGPNFRKGNTITRVIMRLANPLQTAKYFAYKRSSASNSVQKRHILMQRYIESSYEWRIVRVGESYFGHKKLKGSSSMFSGTSLVSWDYPSEDILRYVKSLTDKGSFESMAVDILVSEDGMLHVNELQCFWGSKNKHQMIVDGIPGRFIEKQGKWVFEPGVFNDNNSYNLRMEHVVKMLRSRDVP